jgi:dTDP-4-dehydrorhamnose 3,5-epimerase
MHAQSGKSCQGKMVQAVSGKIFDVITDARPNSDTFGVSDIFELDAKTQNQLWVPRGFLHGFIVPKNQLYSSVFEYFCDNEYNKTSEICKAPLNIIKKILELKTEIDSSFNINIDNYELSEKDSLGLDYINWMDQIKYDYELTGKLWYV